MYAISLLLLYFFAAGVFFPPSDVAASQFQMNNLDATPDNDCVENVVDDQCLPQNHALPTPVLAILDNEGSCIFDTV